MDKDQEFRQQVKQTLDRQRVSEDARRQLHAARMAALANGAQAQRRRWIPATAIATLVLLVGGFFIIRGVGELEMPRDVDEGLAVITSEDELEMFEQLEFYLWFEQEDRV